MNNPIISVIIPVFNVEKYIDKCIKSVLQQTFKNFELLLINDGSKDSSGTICEKWAVLDTRVKVFHQKNKGVSSARNKGISESKGKYICFIDADDWVSKKYLSSFNLNLNVDLQIQELNVYFKSSKNINALEFSKHGLFDNKNICEGIELTESNGLIRGPYLKLFLREKITKHKINFNEKIFYGEDYIFVLEYLLQTSNIFLIKSKNYFFRKRQKGSITSTHIPFHQRYNSLQIILALNYKISEHFSNFSISYYNLIRQNNASHLILMAFHLYLNKQFSTKTIRIKAIEKLKLEKNIAIMCSSNNIGTFDKVIRHILKNNNPNTADALLSISVKCFLLYRFIIKKRE